MYAIGYRAFLRIECAHTCTPKHKHALHLDELYKCCTLLPLVFTLKQKATSQVSSTTNQQGGQWFLPKYSIGGNFPLPLEEHDVWTHMAILVLHLVGPVLQCTCWSLFPLVIWWMALKVYEIVYILQTIKISVLMLQHCNRGKSRAFLGFA